MFQLSLSENKKFFVRSMHAGMVFFFNKNSFGHILQYLGEVSAKSPFLLEPCTVL